MPLSDLYLMNEKEITVLYKELAENFYHDELYTTLFSKDAVHRQIVCQFFKYYIKAIRPYCHFYADSKALQSSMVIWDSQLERSVHYRFRLVWMFIRMFPLFMKLRSWSNIKQVMECFIMLSNRRVKEFVTGAYFHLDVFYTKSLVHYEGVGQKMLTALIEEANIQHREITLEIHHDENLHIYNQAGFVLMSEVVHPHQGMRQLNLLKKNDNEVKQ